jgi:hypothetical protein
MKYKIVSAEIISNLIDFLDEIQFEAAKLNTTDAHHQVNFCNWAINELLNSYNVMTASDLKGGKKKPKKKSRQDYVDETFIDWNLPEMTDEEYEKLVDQFDAFLRGWEKEYYKKNPKKKSKKRKPKFKPPHIDDVSQYMSLEEIREYLLEDPDMTDEEKFELYYQEWERINKKKEKTYSLNQILKGLEIKGYNNGKKKP